MKEGAAARAMTLDTPLPEGWVEGRLGEGLVDVQPGFACGRNDRDVTGVPHLRPMNVSTSGRIELADVKYVPRGEVDRDQRWLRSGDVVFNNTNSPELVGKTAYYGLSEPRAFSNHMTRLRCRAEVLDPRFCALLLHQLWREGFFLSVCNNHVSQASVSRAVLLETPVLLPPIAEQHRIIAVVEAHMARANAVRERLEHVSSVLRRARQAILAAVFAGGVTEDWRQMHRSERPSVKEQPLEGSDDAPVLPEYPDEWTLTTLGTIADQIQYGTSVKANQSGVGVPVLRMGNIQDGRLDLSNLKYVSATRGLEAFLLRKGDILFNRTNSPELVGKAALVGELRKMLFASYLIRVHVDPELAQAEYVCSWINSPWGREWARMVRTDGVSQSNINSSKLAAMPIPLPPLREQMEAVRQMRMLLDAAEATERRLVAAARRVERIGQAVLAKALSGDLVPTEAELARAEGRSYENASALLERMVRTRGTKAANEPARAQSRRRSRPGLRRRR